MEKLVEIKNLVDSALSSLELVECNGWACPGPDAPAQHMATCQTCYAIKDLRKIKALVE